MATAGDARGPGPERAYCAALPATGEVRLDPEESRHLVASRRVRAGEVVVLFDGRGATRRGRLVAADPRAAVVAVEGPAAARDPARDVVLAVSLPEPARTDSLVAGLAELGVAGLVPLTCRRTPPGRADLARRRAPRWARLAREAAKVNGCGRCLEVRPPATLGEVLAAAAGRAVLLDPDPAVPGLVGLLPATGPIPWLLVGPEGGFSDPEVREAVAAGAARARLGLPALRTATAALVAAGLAVAVA